MKLKQAFRISLGSNILFFCAFACAGVQYRWYTPDLPLECYDQGKLLGKPEGEGGWPDLPLTECKPAPSPSPGLHARCGVMLLQDRAAMEKELLECRQALSDCQKGPAPAN